MDVMVSELELQQDLQRFAARFVERITQCAENLQASPRADVRQEALRKNLLYASSATEIATGPSARVNLLDMFVFVHLSRAVLERHWIPSVYRASGLELQSAFETSEDELRDVTLRALGDGGLAQLTGIVDTWLAENAGATRVEGMRLADFSNLAGAAASGRALEARGLLSGMKVATEAANQAMVIAERGLFLLHRLPFLLRMHVRLGVRDTVDDMVQRFRTGSELPSIARLAKRGAFAALFGVVGISLLWMRASRRREG